MRGLLRVRGVAYGELVAAFGTAASEQLTAALGAHTGTETMLVDALALRGLVRSFHFLLEFGIGSG
ncbi:hypothetical protein A3850_005435 [Lewinella sp. 4G2]|nr:hypothetical protein A3850_005435 [Lewinella sp. 4G2]